MFKINQKLLNGKRYLKLYAFINHNGSTKTLVIISIISLIEFKVNVSRSIVMLLFYVRRDLSSYTHGEQYF